MHTVGRWGLRVPDGTDGPPNVPLWMDRLATDLSDVAKDSQGTLAARPTSTALSPGIAGRYYFVTGDPTPANNGRLWRDTGTGWVEIPTGAGQPRDVGEYKFAVDAASHGARVDGLNAWLLCDGTELAAGYVRLIAKLAGNPFGIGAGGRPKLPALAERVPIQPGAAAGLTTRALGASGGEETHLSTAAESGMPDHNHLKPFEPGLGYVNAVQGSFAELVLGSGASLSVRYDSALTGAVSGGARNAAAAHNNMQPFLVAGSWFMYAGTEG